MQHYIISLPSPLFLQFTSSMHTRVPLSAALQSLHSLQHTHTHILLLLILPFPSSPSILILIFYIFLFISPNRPHFSSVLHLPLLHSNLKHSRFYFFFISHLILLSFSPPPLPKHTVAYTEAAPNLALPLLFSDNDADSRRISRY